MNISITGVLQVFNYTNYWYPFKPDFKMISSTSTILSKRLYMVFQCISSQKKKKKRKNAWISLFKTFFNEYLLWDFGNRPNEWNFFMTCHSNYIVLASFSCKTNLSKMQFLKQPSFYYFLWISVLIGQFCWCRPSQLGFCLHIRVTWQVI